MPRRCVVCDRPLIPHEDAVCLSCLTDLPLTYFWTVPRNPMADRFNERIDAPSYAWAVALFYYGRTPGYDHISQALKYERNFVAGRRFSRLLGEKLASADEFADVDCVVPVPLHWTRRWKRGYNQAQEIASEVASVLDAKMDSKMLRRTRRTMKQTGISGSDEKLKNVRGAFEVRRGVSVSPASHILLIDDVFTSGATVSECQKAIRARFGDAARVSVATLAFVG